MFRFVPARVKLPLAHCAWSVPAAAVGAASLVSVTSSYELHDPLRIVQRNTAGVPATTPVTPEVAEFILVMVAVPLCTVQGEVAIGTLCLVCPGGGCWRCIIGKCYLIV